MTSVCSIALNQKSDVVVVFYLGEGIGDFLGGGSFKGETKVFSGRWVGGNNVVCLKSRTLLTFGGGGTKVLGGKVQSPESRVQSPGFSPTFRICHLYLRNWIRAILLRMRLWQLSGNFSRSIQCSISYSVDNTPCVNSRFTIFSSLFAFGSLLHFYNAAVVIWIKNRTFDCLRLVREQ